ncbi:MAG TPA: HD domain-containing phosphohydrolase [Baekduia sp.]|nr:HD domain-containing phosphohydrolase [Baekduia sp.]
MRLLIVDDNPDVLMLLGRILSEAGYEHVQAISDPTAVIELCAQEEPDLILMDLQMPGLDGLQLLERLQPRLEGGSRIAVIMLTGDDSPRARRAALSGGARDFVAKPIDADEILLRVANLLETRRLQRELQHDNQRLEQRVRERTQNLQRSRLETLQRLAVATEFRDDETQQHAWRIGRTAGALARRLQLDQTTAAVLEQAAPLHDIGKLTVPEAILLKTGPLTPAEFEIVKSHTTAGARILAGSASQLLRVASEIAVSHHERWDGTGYPHRLAGGQIPLSGRIVAVADVYDALVYARPYKDAWPVTDAVAEIAAEREHHFDPDVVDAFMALDHQALTTPATPSPPSPLLAGVS